MQSELRILPPITGKLLDDQHHLAVGRNGKITLLRSNNQKDSSKYKLEHSP